MATHRRDWLARVHIDGPLLLGLLMLCAIGLLVLYSASSQDGPVVIKQAMRMGLGLVLMVSLAQVPPTLMARWAMGFYGIGIAMLILVLLIGVGKGAQRWLDIGFFRFQPSELMKLAVPVAVAWYLSERHIPPRLTNIAICTVIILAPMVLVIQQPDLGTALLIGASGFFVLFLAGITWRFIIIAVGTVLVSTPLLWHLMHEYQRQRIIAMFNPEADPLGAGYHIIQSKIAIGSGGFYGKGWLNGTQSQLEFIPEQSTDFIFAVFCEEFGFMGVFFLTGLYIFIIGRGLLIANDAQGAFAKLLGGSLALTFFIYVVVNMGMVSGQLPVVGVPLPLISYGGTSLVTLMVGFGLLMSVHTHKRMLSQ